MIKKRQNVCEFFIVLDDEDGVKFACLISFQGKQETRNEQMEIKNKQSVKNVSKHKICRVRHNFQGVTIIHFLIVIISAHLLTSFWTRWSREV